jgi:hypothetical protein
MNIQFVKVGWLNGTFPMPPGVASQLAARGITAANYSTLLALDPFASGTSIDPGRFLRTGTTFPYEPPALPNGTPNTFTLALTNSTTATTSTTKTSEYTVGASISGSLLSWMLPKLSASNQWTWTDTNVNTQSTSGTETATATVKGPSFGYTGPTDVAVYYDTIYKTFLFSFITPLSLSLTGVVLDRQQRAVAHQPVTLTVKGIAYHTVTNANGQYRFFDTASGSGEVRVNDHVRTVSLGDGSPRVDVTF